MSRGGLVAILAATVALGFCLLLPFCGWLFQCGCTWSWAGGDRHCNVHHARGPHCPWCAYGDAGFAGVEALIVVSQVGAAVLVWRRGGGPVPAAAASMGAYLLSGMLVAYLWHLPSGYPYHPLNPPPPASAAAVPECCAQNP